MGLKKLSVNDNPALGGGAVSHILRALKKHGKIEELDLSRTGIANDQTCMQILGDIIKVNKGVKSVGL